VDGIMNIDKKDFCDLDIDKKLSVIFDNLEDMKKGLKTRKKVDLALTNVAGIIGGILAVFGKWVIFK
jgi:hypothetical protein